MQSYDALKLHMHLISRPQMNEIVQSNSYVIFRNLTRTFKPIMQQGEEVKVHAIRTLNALLK